ncbi:HNH endonuclease signature motif containing protein [Escherichia coli]
MKEDENSSSTLEEAGETLPQCEQPITNQTGWNIHHRIRKVMGGNDELTNLDC